MDTMAEDQLSGSFRAESDYNGEDESSTKCKAISGDVLDTEDIRSSGFDCNICLDCVQDPVVTLCGHLYCWPCMYKWLRLQSMSVENQDQQQSLQQQCPVCKAEVSEATLVPLFGRGQTTKSSKGKATNLGIIIPRRPLGLACGIDSPRSPIATNSPQTRQQTYHRHYPHQSQLHYSQLGSYPASSSLSTGGTMTNMLDPGFGVFGDMIYTRLFGSSITNHYSYPNSYNLAGINSPRVRRHVMQAERSLGRICFFLFCCVFLCFLSF